MASFSFMRHKKVFDVPSLGIGLGLRIAHYQEILKTKPALGWFEIISENFMVEAGKPLHYLDRFSENYRIVQHGVSLSIGSTDPLDFEYLKKLKRLTQRTKTPWFSDHLCWCKHNGHQMHDLLPLPYTEVAAKQIAEKARIVQDFIGLPFLLENLSSYVGFQSSQMEEWEFLSLVAEKANCAILLDVNNIYVSYRNHGFDPMDYLRGIPPERVLQIHVAGHSDMGKYVLDTHDHTVRSEVWELYSKAYEMVGDVAVMLERDGNIPPFREVYEEAMKAKEFQKAILHEPLVA